MKKFMILVLFTIGLGVSFNGCTSQANVTQKEVSKNHSNVVDRYKKACDNGDSESCTSLWSIYSHGNGREIHRNIYKADEYLKKGVELYKKACDGGNGSACINYKLYKKDLLK